MRRQTYSVVVFTLISLTSSISHADNFYAACYGSGTVDKIDSNGNRSIFVSGLVNPTDLAFDRRGNLYVTNYSDDGSVEKIDSSGHRTIFASGLSNPLSLAVDRNDNLYVAVWNEIIKYDQSGNGTVFAHVYSDSDMAFDSSGYLYEHNYANNMIEKINPSGLISDFASFEGGVALAFDQSDNLYASNWMHTIYKYNTSGNRSIFIDSIIKDGWLVECGDIAFDSSGDLYTTDFVAGFLQKIDAGGHMSIIATGMNIPWNIITQPIPEPAMILLLSFGAIILRKKS